MVTAEGSRHDRGTQPYQVVRIKSPYWGYIHQWKMGPWQKKGNTSLNQLTACRGISLGKNQMKKKKEFNLFLHVSTYILGIYLKIYLRIKTTYQVDQLLKINISKEISKIYCHFVKHWFFSKVVVFYCRQRKREKSCECNVASIARKWHLQWKIYRFRLNCPQTK